MIVDTSLQGNMSKSLAVAKKLLNIFCFIQKKILLHNYVELVKGITFLAENITFAL